MGANATETNTKIRCHAQPGLYNFEHSIQEIFVLAKDLVPEEGIEPYSCDSLTYLTSDSHINDLRLSGRRPPLPGRDELVVRRSAPTAG
jgi:hypothetical protein